MLYFSNNRIGPTGAEKIAVGLSKHPCLEVFKVKTELTLLSNHDNVKRLLSLLSLLDPGFLRIRYFCQLGEPSIPK